MNRRLYFLAGLFLAEVALAQEFTTPPHQFTAPAPNARFEILQSPLVAKWTLRLDRFSGRVWQLVKTKVGDPEWEEMAVRESAKIQNASRPRFQLFSSGLTVRDTFLIDSETGKTWRLATYRQKRNDGTEYEEPSWEPFSE